jgi:cobalamin-dependent methionine synthase I
VAYLAFKRSKQAGDKQGNGKILMAIKGDVHDIGKNIVSGVLLVITMRL